MEYGRLGPSDPGGSSRHIAPSVNRRSSGKKKIILLSLFAVVLIVAAAVTATVVRSRTESADSNGPGLSGRPTQAISRTCSKTRFPTLCVNSLVDFPGSATASEKDLVHISFNVTLQHLSKALYSSAAISYAAMDPRLRSAYDDCLELLDDSVDALARSLNTVSAGAVGSANDDVLTWLSAALTNQDTCAEGFADAAAGPVKDRMADNLKDLSELVSNCLAIFASAGAGDDFAGVPIQNRRRLMAMRDDGFPKWLNRRDRRLLGLPLSAVQADIVVSKDGNGTVKTIAEAIKKVPDYGSRRFIIYVRAGRYEEDNLKVGRKKTSVMFIGDGKGKTVITGGKNYKENLTTFHTASFGKFFLFVLYLMLVTVFSSI
ncbi:pectinesterase/pectinesterase inhibitor 61 [Spatholobus suberectus]|nr:pectinesterase/pectinesterase inhibitor 61 [Spatholobus suberectus]